MEPGDLQRMLSTPGGLREAMPETAAFIDSMRQAVGKEWVDAMVVAGLRGQPKFWASENGITIGTRIFTDQLSSRR